MALEYGSNFISLGLGIQTSRISRRQQRFIGQHPTEGPGSAQTDSRARRLGSHSADRPLEPADCGAAAADPASVRSIRSTDCGSPTHAAGGDARAKDGPQPRKCHPPGHELLALSRCPPTTR